MENSNQYFLVKVYKTSELDHYEKGCDPKSYNDHGEIHSFKAKSFEEILETIDSKNVNIFEDRLEMTQLEDAAGLMVDPEKDTHIMESFKQDKIKLWLCDYSYYITLVSETELDNNDLKSAFPNLNEG